MEVPDLPFDALVLVLASAGHARLRTVSRDWRDAVQAARAHRLWLVRRRARWLRMLVRARAAAWIASRRSRPCSLRVLPAQQLQLVEQLVRSFEGFAGFEVARRRSDPRCDAVRPWGQGSAREAPLRMILRTMRAHTRASPPRRQPEVPAMRDTPTLDPPQAAIHPPCRRRYVPPRRAQPCWRFQQNWQPPGRQPRRSR